MSLYARFIHSAADKDVTGAIYYVDKDRFASSYVQALYAAFKAGYNAHTPPASTPPAPQPDIQGRIQAKINAALLVHRRPTVLYLGSEERRQLSYALGVLDLEGRTYLGLEIIGVARAKHLAVY